MRIKRFNWVAWVLVHRLALEPDEQDRFCSRCGARNPWTSGTCQGCGGPLG